MAKFTFLSSINHTPLNPGRACGRSLTLRPKFHRRPSATPSPSPPPSYRFGPSSPLTPDAGPPRPAPRIN